MTSKFQKDTEEHIIRLIHAGYKCLEIARIVKRKSVFIRPIYLQEISRIKQLQRQEKKARIIEEMQAKKAARIVEIKVKLKAPAAKRRPINPELIRINEAAVAEVSLAREKSSLAQEAKKEAAKKTREENRQKQIKTDLKGIEELMEKGVYLKNIAITFEWSANKLRNFLKTHGITDYRAHDRILKQKEQGAKNLQNKKMAWDFSAHNYVVDKNDKIIA